MEVTAYRVEKIKKALREATMPMFTDEDIEDLIETSENIDEAIYRGAVMKAENTTLQVSGLTTADQSSYFLRIASLYRPNNSGVLKG